MNSKKLSHRVRKIIIEIVYKAQASHIGSALSIIDILSVLYTNILNVFPEEPEHPSRDRFILSKGHACVGVYTVLAECGFFDKKMLSTYGENNSILMHHISHKVPGVEFSTGSLGHGLPFGVGKSLAAKKRDETWTTYVLMSDGEMQAGSNWEALLFATHHKLDNLIAIIDYNNLQSLSTVDDTLSIRPLNDKLKSFGWHVLEVDGHDHNALKECFEEARLLKNKPISIIANTIKGKGVSFMENKVEWHYKSPTEEEFLKAIRELEYA